MLEASLVREEALLCHVNHISFDSPDGDSLGDRGRIYLVCGILQAYRSPVSQVLLVSFILVCQDGGTRLPSRWYPGGFPTNV